MAGGRKRGFCKTEALEKAMKIFWKKGYVGTSLADLTDGLGINKPSMYAAFGNKEQLFVAACEYYLEHHVKPLTDNLHKDGPVKERIKDYLLNVLNGQCSDEGPKGCFISLSISESEGDMLPEAASKMVETTRDFGEVTLAEFLESEKKKGNLPEKTDSKHIARYLITMLHGTAAMARGGKTADELSSIIDTTVEAVL